MSIEKDKYQRFYESYDWRRARYDALCASDGKCQLCGRGKHDGVTLNVDHIVPIKRAWNRRTDRTNLQVLCHECNHGKGNRDTTDWRGDEPKIRAIESKPKRRKARRVAKKRRAARAKADRKKSIERWKYGSAGKAGNVRIVSIDEWIADKVREAQKADA